MSNKKFLIIMLVLALFTAGCGTKQAVDTKSPVTQLGTIDMNKAVKAHPKYNQLMVLGQQADVMAAKLEAGQAAAHMASVTSMSEMSERQITELNKSFEQEFSAKMSAKQEELSPQLVAKADAVRNALSKEMNTYSDQLDKEYQPQIFNLQLKLKTVQLTKEEATVLQTQLEKIQAQRSEALATKQGQLAARMDELLAPEKAAIEEQLATYAQELNQEISQQASKKQGEFVGRNNEQQSAVAQTDKESSQIQEQLAMKQQEIQALQGFIIANITEKTAKVATENGFEAVLINVAVNVSAVDITAQVIAECNK